VGATIALVEEADYFRLLGVGREASRDEIARAHQMLRRDLGPESLEPSVLGSMKEEVAAIRDVLDEGWRVLGDDDRKRRYRAALGPQTLRETSQQTSRDDGRVPVPAREERS
jgi:DnaJ-class molecular chaperone